MVFRVQASISFDTVGQRNSAQTGIASAIGQRGGTLLRNAAVTLRGDPALAVEVEFANQADAQFVFDAIAAQPKKASRSNFHACFHGELEQACVPIASVG